VWTGILCPRIGTHAVPLHTRPSTFEFRRRRRIYLQADLLLVPHEGRWCVLPQNGRPRVQKVKCSKYLFSDITVRVSDAETFPVIVINLWICYQCELLESCSPFH
jgi:hypothetical protein